MHIGNPTVRHWLQRRMGVAYKTARAGFPRTSMLRILQRGWTDAVVFEEFLRGRIPGAKTFSLEGCGSTGAVAGPGHRKSWPFGGQRRSSSRAWDIAAGLAMCWPTSSAKARAKSSANSPMTNRNAGWLRRRREISPWAIARQLDGNGRTAGRSSCRFSFQSEPSRIRESGRAATGVRAHQERPRLSANGGRYWGLLIHGDAAFAGEGVVQETPEDVERKLAGYSVGGNLAYHREQPDRFHHAADGRTFHALSDGRGADATGADFPCGYGEDPEAGRPGGASGWWISARSSSRMCTIDMVMVTKPVGDIMKRMSRPSRSRRFTGRSPERPECPGQLSGTSAEIAKCHPRRGGQHPERAPRQSWRNNWKRPRLDLNETTPDPPGITRKIISADRSRWTNRKQV